VSDKYWLGANDIEDHLRLVALFSYRRYWTSEMHVGAIGFGVGADTLTYLLY
jgi:hypothetical protein